MTNEPYPRLSVVREVSDDGAHHIGPFGSRRAAQDAVDAIHEAVPLRRCTRRLPKVAPAGATACALAEIGRCSAPCLPRSPDSTIESAADAGAGTTTGSASGTAPGTAPGRANGTAISDTAGGYAATVDLARSAMLGDASAVVTALSEQIRRHSRSEEYEQAGDVSRRLGSFLRGASRTQSIGRLAACPEVVAARPTEDAGWELVVIKHARLAATAVAPRGEDPRPHVDALRATADDVPAPVLPAPACHPHEADIVLAWLDRPGTRLVEIDGVWSSPVRSALSYDDLAAAVASSG
ncbi:hypothetical protein GCM10025865_26280 [Paraoerskovia sediminicola]|uniref:DUF222 domain-containing protein n=1 Tax=Paraoerskovia sediminicola TaxID=1138587 RepID=A0ABM8G550_9CELL|nr:hypothetical protein GCM10025865_26280 [Paraoerskovia sediminicola]